MPHDKRVSYGVAVLLWRGSKLLLLRRKGSHAAETWACPGGWVDFGETARETAVREAMEELGVKVEIDDFCTFREETWRERELQSLTLYFHAHVVEGTPRIMEPDKASELRWVNPRDVDSWPEPLFPNLHDVLVELAMDMDDLEPDVT